MVPPARVPERPLNVLAIGAHFDDCELKFGGTAIKYAKQGHAVRFHSLTNGEAGHHEMGGLELTERRREEATAAAEVAGVECSYFDNHEGELLATIENRNDVIRLVRDFEADVVFTHRPNDYHPDHRYGARLVRDAAYMGTVPSIVRDTDHLEYIPIICHFEDSFEDPSAFEGDIVVDIDDEIDQKMRMLHQHESQMYEWLPYNENILEEVPEGSEQRFEWLKRERMPENAEVADQFRDTLVEEYGPDHGRQVEYAEAFEISEYGGLLTEENEAVLFPFGP